MRNDTVTISQACRDQLHDACHIVACQCECHLRTVEYVIPMEQALEFVKNASDEELVDVLLRPLREAHGLADIHGSDITRPVRGLPRSPRLLRDAEPPPTDAA